MIVILLNTGLRRSELLGLQWRDIDYSNNTISVKRAITPGTTTPEDGDVKSITSYRVIPVSQEFIDYLKTVPHKTDYVIAGKTEYGYMSIDGFEGHYKRFMKIACEEN